MLDSDCFGLVRCLDVLATVELLLLGFTLGKAEPDAARHIYDA